MLWDKHLFVRNMTEPLTGSVACACPHVPEVSILLPERRRPQGGPERGLLRAGHTALTPVGAVRGNSPCTV